MLRIEDTDRERSTPENVEQILDALRWLNLDWDEGPVFQSERAERHREVLEQLLESGHAYHSTATTDDVQAYKERHGFERGFRGVPEREGAVRLRVPDEGETVVRRHHPRPDPVREREHGRLRDRAGRRVGAVRVREPGRRSRRGDHRRRARRGSHLEHAQAAAGPRRARDAEPPRYAHLPLLHGPDGRKLSKRHGAASVQELRAAGYLPEAVDNYIALLGAGFAADEEFFTLDELAAAVPARARLEEPGGVRRAQAAPPRTGAGSASSGPTSSTRAARGVHRPRPACGGAVEISEEKIQTLAEFWPLVGVPVRRARPTIRRRSRR